METEAPREKGASGASKTVLVVAIAVVAVCVVAGVAVAIVFAVDSGSSSSGSNSDARRGGADGSVNLVVSAPSALNNIDQAELVKAKRSDDARKALLKAVDVSAFPARSAYNLDTTEIYLNDPIQEPIENVNNILCQIKQAGFGYWMPVDPAAAGFDEICYLAQINVKLCDEDESGGDDSSGGGGGGGGSNQAEQRQAEMSKNRPSFVPWTVCLTNDVANREYVARIWFDNEDDDDEGDDDDDDDGGLKKSIASLMGKRRPTYIKGAQPRVKTNKQAEDSMVLHGKMTVSYDAIQASADNAESAVVPAYTIEWAACMDALCLERGFINIAPIEDDATYNLGLSYWASMNMGGFGSTVNLEMTARGLSHTENDVGAGVISFPDMNFDNGEFDPSTGCYTVSPEFTNQQAFFSFDASHTLKEVVVSEPDVQDELVICDSDKSFANKALKNKAVDRKQASTTTCLDRENTLRQGYDYKLYNSRGGRVKVNTGESIYKVINGERYYGYASVWGVYGPQDDQGNELFVDGTEVMVERYDMDGNAAPVTRTIRQFGGRMEKVERLRIALRDITNLDLSFHPSCEGSCSELKVKWNGSQFVAFKQYNWTTNKYDTLSPPKPLVPGESDSEYKPTNWWFYSESLGSISVEIGEYYYHFNGDSWEYGVNYTTLTGATEFTSEQYTNVAIGEAVPSPLYCFDGYSCPIAANLNVAGLDYSSYYHDIEDDLMPFADLPAYTYDTDNPVLKEGGVDVVITQESSDSRPTYLWTSLVANTPENVEMFKCEDSDNTCPGYVDRQNIPSVYQWSSAADPWSKRTVLVKDDGSVVEYQEPILVEYTHKGNHSNTGTNYYNNKFTFHYSGYDLCCMPHICINRNQEVVDCYDGDVWNYVSDISIPAGSTLVGIVNGQPSGVEYVTKPLYVEENMIKLDESECSSLTVDKTIASPSSSEYNNPLEDSFPRPVADNLEVLMEGGELAASVNCTVDARCNDIGNRDLVDEL